ncbi:protein of unknown function [Azospirillum lipoferum 4B]|uniref:Uncharacterized protein n=1 Tax=Azospirillum lipoferum (strain 4B) TaxID=862719 RepID=G7Z4H9_AZOL4|nr:protein of unknown function [Azospirillum lipoferum 4B]
MGPRQTKGLRQGARTARRDAAGPGDCWVRRAGSLFIYREWMTDRTDPDQKSKRCAMHNNRAGKPASGNTPMDSKGRAARPRRPATALKRSRIRSLRAETQEIGQISKMQKLAHLQGRRFSFKRKSL